MDGGVSPTSRIRDKAQRIPSPATLAIPHTQPFEFPPLSPAFHAFDRHIHEQIVGKTQKRRHCVLTASVIPMPRHPPGIHPQDIRRQKLHKPRRRIFKIKIVEQNTRSTLLNGQQLLQGPSRFLEKRRHIKHKDNASGRNATGSARPARRHIQIASNQIGCRFPEFTAPGPKRVRARGKGLSHGYIRKNCIKTGDPMLCSLNAGHAACVQVNQGPKKDAAPRHFGFGVGSRKSSDISCQFIRERMRHSVHQSLSVPTLYKNRTKTIIKKYQAYKG